MGDMQKNFSSSIIHNSPNLETMKISNSGVDKEGSRTYIPITEFSTAIKKNEFLEVKLWIDLTSNVD